MDALSMVPLTLFLGKAAAAAGTTSTLTTTGTMVFGLRGKAVSRAAFTNQATPTTDITTGAAFVAVAAGFGAVVVLGLDSAGTLRACQGPQLTLDGIAAGASASFIIAPQFPPIPDTVCPFAYVVVKVGTAGAAWTFGTSNLTGPPANTAITFVDVVTMPDRPQVA